MKYTICTILSLSYLFCTAQPRVEFGKQRLAAAAGRGRSIFISFDHANPHKEAYTIDVQGSRIHITASDASGALYGCLTLADIIKTRGYPRHLHLSDHPGMVLRGACIGLQKTTLLPGRGPYEYPYTPENFPWFYNKTLWTKYLDSMVDNRLNTLYLWNGHPFASLVRLPEYPYAVEVDDATFRKNEEMFRWLTAEADRRGIWVIQLFYNIIVSKPFSKKNHLKTQDRNRHIIPIIADYTRKSIAAFVQKYPNVGLAFTLGEAMEGVGQDDIDWLTKTIIPGVKDGLRALGRTDEPPLVVRAHDTDGPADLAAALPLYKNLYVMAKYNGEALTTYTPHGPWADLHRKLSSVSQGLVENVHILANLEPFRYGSPDFIQHCVQAMHDIDHANSIHLYPQASYWDWPYSADSVAAHGAVADAAGGSAANNAAARASAATAAEASATNNAATRASAATGATAAPYWPEDASGTRLLEMDRDWIWYKAWARYAWNCNRPRQDEIAYWSSQLAQKYGVDTATGHLILDAYEESGEISPKLLRRFGITDGNRQTLTLGMFMTQLIDPERYGLFSLLYESEGPPGEMLSQYAEREWKHLPHEGETPIDVINSTRAEGIKAMTAIDKAAPHVTSNRAEFERLRNDMYCYHWLAEFYDDKAAAALDVLRYNYSADRADLVRAYTSLSASVDAFRELTRLTNGAYRYANSMQTPQRKIPIRGAGGHFITWHEMLPLYEDELKHFRTHLDSLRSPGFQAAAPPVFQPADVRLEDSAYYTLDSGAHPYADTNLVIRTVAEPLRGLKAFKTSAAGQRRSGTTLHFKCAEPVDLLIGFFEKKSSALLAPPQLETDASANDYGQAEPRIANALILAGMPAVNVHAWSFKPGEHTLELGKGLCLILGFVKPTGMTRTYDASLNEPGKKNLDWLFE